MNFPSMKSAMRQFLFFGQEGGMRIPLMIGFFIIYSLLGETKRQPWTTSKVKGRPGLGETYRIVEVHPNLNFQNPVELVAMPGSDLMWMVELRGAIYAFSSQRSKAEKHEVAHLKEFVSNFSSAYGLAFHPDFATNRQIFLCYVVGGNQSNGTRVSRFKVTNTNPPTIIEETEEILITWKGGGHNGGCLKFGPDGYLYISTGDASGPNPPDVYNTGQDNSDLLSAILRIDVNRKDEGLPYAIPNDNPFLNLTNTRPEIWAFGFRNPFKMSFDSKLGELWVGDVGWELWELIYRVERGGNYGWSIMEGNHEIQPNLQKGPGKFRKPIIEHPHSEAASITGGFVYRGSNLQELKGAYIYGDWETGKIWGLRTNEDQVTWQSELTDTSLKIITFGENHEGELYIVDYAGGLYELKPNESNQRQSDFPQTLSNTGLFQNVTKHEVAEGVYPYEIEMQPWENEAIAKRWIALPDYGKVEVRDRLSVFPKNAVILKTLFWPDTPDKKHLGLPIESQLLHFDGQSWNAYTYAWNKEGSDGILIKKEGAVVDEKNSELMAGELSSAGEIGYWKFSSRSDCLRCHNSWSGFALGWNSLQLQGTERAPASLSKSWNELIQNSLIGGRKPRAFKSGEELTELEYQAKAYLHANCAHCHRENAGGMVNALMYFEKPLEKASLIGAAPIRGNFDLTNPSIISPGDPFNSILYYRMAKSGSGQMPHLGVTKLDSKGLNLLFDWIKLMPEINGNKDNLTEKILEMVRISTQQTSFLGFEANLNKLLIKSEGALGISYAIDNNRFTSKQEKEIENFTYKTENHLSREILIRNFKDNAANFNLLDTEKILALNPDIANGEQLFFKDPTFLCSECHQLNGKGKVFGPDLTSLQNKYSSKEILDQIVSPSKTIEPKFEYVSIETELGEILSGIIMEDLKESLLLKDVAGKVHRIKKSQIIDQQISKLSAMPEGLLNGRSSQEIADLLGVLNGNFNIE